jgi:propanol-preferring alcohol dehydrogenase
MLAMVLSGLVDLAREKRPLALLRRDIPKPGPGEVLIRVSACGVCHTELDEIEGRTPPPRYPVVPGHQVAGRVVERGEGAFRFSAGDRVGVGWIWSSCGTCGYCQSGFENLCPGFIATGRDAHGGYAQYMTVPEQNAHPLPETHTDAQAAPLLCAGAIGWRSLRLAGIEGRRTLGLTGFGASAHLVLKIVRHRWPDTRVYVFSRTPSEREFALEEGAVWAGAAEETSPEALETVIDTTPAWRPVAEALKNLAPGGRLVINAIRKEERDKDALLSLDYPRDLWMEKEIKTVANVARRDVAEFLQMAGEIPIMPEVEEYALEEANQALVDLKERRIRGAKVLRIP